MNTSRLRCPRRGLYVITEPGLIGGERLLPAVSAALEGGACMIQYRDKSQEHNRRQDEAAALNALCNAASVPLIINDDIDLAAAVGAAGVHLGLSDSSPAEARRRLGPEAIIGVTCHADPDAPYTTHADYAAFGRFFPSATKPDAPPAPLDILQQARNKLPIPIVAIGGINATNATEVLAAGADMLAVVGAVFGAPDIKSAARRLSSFFS